MRTIFTLQLALLVTVLSLAALCAESSAGWFAASAPDWQVLLGVVSVMGSFSGLLSTGRIILLFEDSLRYERRLQEERVAAKEELARESLHYLLEAYKTSDPAAYDQYLAQIPPFLLESPLFGNDVPHAHLPLEPSTKAVVAVEEPPVQAAQVSSAKSQEPDDVLIRWVLLCSTCQDLVLQKTYTRVGDTRGRPNVPILCGWCGRTTAQWYRLNDEGMREWCMICEKVVESVDISFHLHDPSLNEYWRCGCGHLCVGYRTYCVHANSHPFGNHPLFAEHGVDPVKTLSADQQD